MNSQIKKGNSINKPNYKKYPSIPHEDIAWVAFRMLFEESKEIIIDNSFRDKFNNKVDYLYHLPYFEKTKIINRWLELPYIYRGDLRNYDTENI